METKTIHIVTDAAFGGVLRSIGETGPILVCADALSFGPIKDCSDQEAWVSVRTEFWREFFGCNDTYDPRWHNGRRFSDDEILLLRSADRVTLWVGSNIDDHLFFIWCVTNLRLLDIEAEKIDCIFQPPLPSNRLEGLSLAGITIQAARELLAQRDALTIEDEGVVRKAWKTITASDPKSLNLFEPTTYRKLNQTALAVSVLKRRYPSVTNGLTRYDQRLLAACERFGPRISDVFSNLMALNGHDYTVFRDSIAWTRLCQMGLPSLELPIVKIENVGKNFGKASALLTEHGKRMLCGDIDLTRRNGYDLWVGGVHLPQAGDEMWFYDESTDSVVRA